MKRFFSMILLASMASFFALQAAVVIFDFSTAEGITAMGYTVPEPSAGTNLVQAGDVTVDGVTLSAADGATPTRIWNSQGSFSLRIYVDGSITLSVAEGSITGITVNAASATNFDLIADVGNYVTGTTVGSWTGNASSVTLTHVGTKNAQVHSLMVITDSDEPVDPDPEDPIDPNITKVDSLNHIADLVSGTEFQFTTEVYVNYQWNEFMWVMQLDSEGNALAGHIYGDTGKEYRLGSVIPAGWTGVKKTYRGLVEVGEPAHFANAKNILDEYYYLPFDCTGYMHEIADPENGWQNYKVFFEGVRLSEIGENGLFTISCLETDEEGATIEASLTGFNKFGIEYPDADPTELYDIEGMMVIYDGVMELYPISITADPGTRLWKVLYEGEDEQQYKLNDTLYVAAVSEADKLVYVTDNVDEIYYDTYAEWGYAEWMTWYPDWIALDCSGEEGLFDAVAGMEVLDPGTVKGILKDRLTNPRLVLNSMPFAVADAKLPTLTLFRYDLSKDYLGARGNELGSVDGYFFVKDGVPSLCSEQDSVVVKLNFDYNPELEQQMMDHEGYLYNVLAIFKLDEVWEESLGMRRITATADDYYTNYTIYPLQILSQATVDEVVAGKQAIGVQYVTPDGVMSATPRDGVNIEVTTYGDGSRAVVKRVMKQ